MPRYRNEAAMGFLKLCDARALVLLLAVACVSACDRADYRARYVPAEDKARRALTVALRAWQQGSAGPQAIDEKTGVELVDQGRRDGQLLKHFTILGEVSVEGGRWFEVELFLEEPAETQRERYCVIGIDPLWVFRQTDYEQIAHWDHPMPAEPAAP
jgi:hypothetical protein